MQLLQRNEEPLTADRCCIRRWEVHPGQLPRDCRQSLCTGIQVHLPATLRDSDEREVAQVSCLNSRTYHGGDSGAPYYDLRPDGWTNSMKASTASTSEKAIPYTGKALISPLVNVPSETSGRLPQLAFMRLTLSLIQSGDHEKPNPHPGDPMAQSRNRLSRWQTPGSYPHICLKQFPPGGGKTLLAATALERYDYLH